MLTGGVPRVQLQDEHMWWAPVATYDKKYTDLNLPYDARLAECPEVHVATRENSGEGETL